MLSGTPYRRATAQMEPDDSMAISTSARTFGGYFCPRREPFTVFLQYARLATALPPLCGSSLPVYSHRKNKTTADIFPAVVSCMANRPGLPSHPSRKAPLARGAVLQRRRQADCKAERFSSHISPAAAAYIPTVLSASSSLW